MMVRRHSPERIALLLAAAIAAACSNKPLEPKD